MLAFDKITKDIKKDILGKDYELSIAFVSAAKSKELNKKYRSKNKPTNVLSFGYSKNSGELVLCKEVIKKEIEKFGRTFDELLLFLVIHGMLHLKGMQHGSIMGKAEKFYCSKYDKKHLNRNRRGFGDDASRGGRIRKRRQNS